VVRGSLTKKDGEALVTVPVEERSKKEGEIAAEDPSASDV
jgi:hypothetical protein